LHGLYNRGSRRNIRLHDRSGRNRRSNIRLNCRNAGLDGWRIFKRTSRRRRYDWLICNDNALSNDRRGNGNIANNWRRSGMHRRSNRNRRCNIRLHGRSSWRNIGLYRRSNRRDWCNIGLHGRCNRDSRCSFRLHDRSNRNRSSNIGLHLRNTGLDCWRTFKRASRPLHCNWLLYNNDSFRNNRLFHNDNALSCYRLGRNIANNWRSSGLHSWGNRGRWRRFRLNGRNTGLDGCCTFGRARYPFCYNRLICDDNSLRDDRLFHNDNALSYNGRRNGNIANCWCMGRGRRWFNYYV